MLLRFALQENMDAYIGFVDSAGRGVAIDAWVLLHDLRIDRFTFSIVIVLFAQ